MNTFTIFVVVLVAAAVNATDPDCTSTNYSGAEKTVCEKWDWARFLWSPGSVTGLGNTNPVPLNSVNVDPSKGKLLSPNCVNVDPKSGATWYGYRYAMNSKQSVVSMYDCQGSFSGIQARIPKSSGFPGSTFNYTAVGMFQSETVNGIDYWVLTAYTVDPMTICKETGGKGRPASALTTNNGAGDRLVFQNGKTPAAANLLKAPRMWSDAKNSGYADNNCFSTMGTHTFAGMEKVYQTNNCDTITPCFLLFNEAGYLVGFGFDWVGCNSDTDSFESPDAGAIKKIVGDHTPQCLLDIASNGKCDKSGITTIHVFFVKRNPNNPTISTPITCNKPPSS